MINASVSVSVTDSDLSALTEPPPEDFPESPDADDSGEPSTLIDAAISAVSAICSLFGICADPNFEQEPEDDEDQECE